MSYYFSFLPIYMYILGNHMFRPYYAYNRHLEKPFIWS